jgi:hypothetical protein
VPVKILKVEDLHCDASWRVERFFRFFHQQPCSMRQKALSISLGALAFFGIGLAVAQASSYSSCTNSYTQGIAAAQGYGSWKCDCARRACAATARQPQALKETIVQVGPGGEGGSIRPVLLSEIEHQATISVAPGVTLDFSDGGANNVTVQTSDNPSVVQITSKTNVVTVAPGTAHLNVANVGRCPKPTGMQVVSCDPIPIYPVTINVQYRP